MKKVQTLKGFRDIDPEEALKRGRAVSLLKSVFKSYGFAPLETPTLEYASVLEGKYGEEGEKLIYKFKDRGGRDAALRYDLTVPLARYIAQNKGKIIFPFKRYQIGSVFRADKPQAGRYREFTQVDIDTIGTDTALADAEILAVISSCLEILGVKNFKILVNDRNLFNELPKKAVLILDKLDKIGEPAVIEELNKTNLEGGEILKNAQSQKPTPRLVEIFALLKSFGIPKTNFGFNPLLARGLDYYTGMVYEAVVEGTPGSISGGGRYNNMIGIFGKEKIPAVGGSFGLDRLTDVVPKETLAEIPFRPQVLVTIFSKELLAPTIELFDQVQGTGVEAELYLDPEAKLDKQLKYADKKGARYALILGPEEVKNNRVTVKDLRKRTQETIDRESLFTTLKKH
ncbi:histidine--tRNA ligase [candidate division WWE3 bacterium RBG_19FT_COMBO_53_11]|uniref:Histidine--tRNA ligase n=1 Tax=candidate division WWE3 bacterium RBG_19FT_COMBO_53_11 TaxID=1802613 RepID=A0A1F4UI67_UNCKA|nr:MAG: histidine--tRNA ligase [candidate division WWE3 bacterium RBG_16_52_45]OGC44654.1 MAG: histidine--tRNA ligase [candidate division WWE3 bacterium RBG_19FT_COMBO_53_11]